MECKVPSTVLLSFLDRCEPSGELVGVTMGSPRVSVFVDRPNVRCLWRHIRRLAMNVARCWKEMWQHSR